MKTGWSGAGVAFDGSGELKGGDATECAGPQHAGCTGHVENCVTTVFSAYVTTSGQAWADFDVFMPEGWAKDTERRRAAGHPGRPGARPSPGWRQTSWNACGRPACRPAERGDHPAGLPHHPAAPRSRDGMTGWSLRTRRTKTGAPARDRNPRKT